MCFSFVVQEKLGIFRNALFNFIFFVYHKSRIIAGSMSTLALAKNYKGSCSHSLFDELFYNHSFFIATYVNHQIKALCLASVTRQGIYTTPARTKTSSLEIDIFDLKMMVKSGLGLNFEIHLQPLQSCCCPVQKNLPRKAELAWRVKVQLISKCPYEKSVWTKYQKKIFLRFLSWKFTTSRLLQNRVYLLANRTQTFFLC